MSLDGNTLPHYRGEQTRTGAGVRRQNYACRCTQKRGLNQSNPALPGRKLGAEIGCRKPGIGTRKRKGGAPRADPQQNPPGAHAPLTQHANYAPRAANRSSRAACAACAKPSTDGPAASTPRLEFTNTCDSTPANTRYRSAAEAPAHHNPATESGR